MNDVSSHRRQAQKYPSQDETVQDLIHGQIVIVIARWILVATALVFTFWNPGPLSQLRVQIIVILLLAFGNFYLHIQLLMKRPVVKEATYGASIGDIIVITVIMMMQGGFPSWVYPFYFPAILAYSVAFPGGVTFLLTSGIVGLYLLVGSTSLALAEPPGTTVDYQVLLTRLLMFVAIAFCGSMYQRIERKRRREALEAQDMLLAQVSSQQ